MLAAGLERAQVLAQETLSSFPTTPGRRWRGQRPWPTSISVRRGPGTSYAVVDVLRAGQSVRISNCNGGWCRVNHGGPSGWVSQNFLSRTGSGGGDSGAIRRRACFYDDIRFRGRSFCVGVGDVAGISAPGTTASPRSASAAQ